MQTDKEEMIEAVLKFKIFRGELKEIERQYIKNNITEGSDDEVLILLASSIRSVDEKIRELEDNLR
jgi:hypothetical protein